MIWGKTEEQKEMKQRQLGDMIIRFVYFPHQLKNGRWVWWEYVKCVLAASRGGRYWSYHEIVENPKIGISDELKAQVKKLRIDRKIGISDEKYEFEFTIQAPNGIVLYTHITHDENEVMKRIIRRSGLRNFILPLSGDLSGWILPDINSWKNFHNFRILGVISE